MSRPRQPTGPSHPGPSRPPEPPRPRSAALLDQADIEAAHALAAAAPPLPQQATSVLLALYGHQPATQAA